MYTMSNEEISTQLGKLMLDKRACEQKLADLTLKAKNIGKQFTDIGRQLESSPERIQFPHQSVDTRFHPMPLADGRLATAEDVRALVEAIREERINLWNYQDQLKRHGF